MAVLGAALSEHRVKAEIIDVDHYSIHSGLAVETDYIVEVTIQEGPESESFKISKKYSEFRSLASAIKKAAEIATSDVKKTQVKKKKGDWNALPKHVKQLVHFSESLTNLIESEKTTYLGKLTYTYVKSISKQRRSILDQALDTILEFYPTENLQEPGIVALTGAVETFFLTDHVEEDDTTSHSTKRKSSTLKMKSKSAPQVKDTEAKPVPKKPAAKERSKTPHVVPISKRARRSVVIRAQDDKMLNELGAKFILEEDIQGATPSSAHSVESPYKKSFDSPFAFMAVAVAVTYAFHFASESSLTVDSDIALFIGFACFCLGLHSPLSAGRRIAKPPSPTVKQPGISVRDVRSQRRQSDLLKRSMMQSMKSMKQLAAFPEGVDDEDDNDDALIEELAEEEGGVTEQLMSPLPTFPKNAVLGTVPNCVSETPPSEYHVRGPKYFQDKKKIPSGPFLFPFRGVDLFLTDLCPENVGSNTGAMGGHLREKPTFIVNFRLPWAVLLFYAEIPVRLLPFLRACYDPKFDKSTLPLLSKMSPAERTAARYLMGSEEHKNDCLKIVPVVVKGPWVVKTAVGGKPAIIGNKMPVTYYYQPAEKGKAEYLEMDLDIVASAAARGILSVVKNYTSILTLDLGFVVEGKSEDELPEQMMVGTRLHSIDPLTAPPLPPMADLLLDVLSGPDGDD